jgi:hypothetical protein
LAAKFVHNFSAFTHGTTLEDLVDIHRGY